MAISAHAALWFLPFVLPICFYVAYTDMAEMRITNPSVIALALVFVAVGPFVMSFEPFMWRLAQLGIVLIVGFVLNAAGIVGAGDAKFAAAAAPFIAVGDLRFLMILFTVVLLAAVLTHRGAKYTPLRQLAPRWLSWDQDKKFPMGLALGTALAAYLILGARFGS